MSKDNEKKYDAEIIARMTLVDGGKAEVQTGISGNSVQLAGLIHEIVTDTVSKEGLSPIDQIMIENSIAIILLEAMRKFKMFETEGSLVEFTKKFTERVKETGGLDW